MVMYMFFVPIRQLKGQKVIILLFVLVGALIMFDLRLFSCVLSNFFMFNDNLYIFV